MQKMDSDPFLRFDINADVKVWILLAMIANSAVQLSTQARIHDSIMLIDTLTMLDTVRLIG